MKGLNCAIVNLADAETRSCLLYTSVETVGILILLQDFADDHGAVFAGIGHDLARRSRERFADDVDAGPLVVVVRSQLLEHLAGA